MKWQIVKHSKISRNDLMRIAKLKDQHWPNGIASQLEWMRNNVFERDDHLIGEDEDGIKAYITLSCLDITIDEIKQHATGVGCVCVDKRLQGIGIGKELVSEANRFIINHDATGILLCKDELVDFYSKCKWEVLRYQEAKVAGRNYNYNIMHFNGLTDCRRIFIDRDF